MVWRQISIPNILKGIHLAMAIRLVKPIRATHVSEGAVPMTGVLASPNPPTPAQEPWSDSGNAGKAFHGMVQAVKAAFRESLAGEGVMTTENDTEIVSMWHQYCAALYTATPPLT